MNIDDNVQQNMMDENINVHLAEKFCDGMIFIKMGWSTREKYVVMQTVKK